MARRFFSSLSVDAAVAGLRDRVACASSSRCARAVARIAATQRLRASSGDDSFCSWARRAALTALSTSGKTPRRPRGTSTSRRRAGGGARRDVEPRSRAAACAPPRPASRARSPAPTRASTRSTISWMRASSIPRWTLPRNSITVRWMAGETLDALLAHARALVGVELSRAGRRARPAGAGRERAHQGVVGPGH